MQILSGGKLKATSHAVVGLPPSSSSSDNFDNISRNTFAVFIEPNFDEKLVIPEGYYYFYYYCYHY
jgi:isopenicillin N synthase-like dioxygenase